MNKFKFLAAIAIVATLATLTTSCEKSTEQKKQLIKKEIQTLEKESERIREKHIKENTDGKGRVLKLPSKEEINKAKERTARLDSLRNALKQFTPYPQPSR